MVSFDFVIHHSQKNGKGTDPDCPPVMTGDETSLCPTALMTTGTIPPVWTEKTRWPIAPKKDLLSIRTRRGESYEGQHTIRSNKQHRGYESEKARQDEPNDARVTSDGNVGRRIGREDLVQELLQTKGLLRALLLPDRVPLIDRPEPIEEQGKKESISNAG